MRHWSSIIPRHPRIRPRPAPQALAPLMSPAAPQYGVFAAACFIHTSFSPTRPLIGGVSWQTALGRWYFNRAGGGYKLADDCGELCGVCP